MPTIDNDNLKGLLEQDETIAAAVAKEIKSMGDQVKENFTELQKGYKKLKELVDERGDDTYDKNFIDKLSLDIAARQEDLDKKFDDSSKGIAERIDNIEVALKRPHVGNPTADNLYDEKTAFNFATAILSMKGAEKGVLENDVIKFQEENKDFLKHYSPAFLKYIKQRGNGQNFHAMLTPEEQKAMLVGSDPDGGVLVTPAMSAKIIERLYESDPIRQLASVESITTGAIEWLVDWDEADAGWETETVTGSATDTPTWQKKRIPVHFMYARPRVTQTLIEDAGINVENWLAGKVADKMSRVEAEAFVNGDGIMKPRGFLTYANGTTYGTIEQVNMGAAAALTADGFVSLKYSLIEQYLERCTWLMSRSTLAAAMKLKNGVGDYIWKPSMIVTDPNSAILNLPVKMSTSMPTIAANSLSVALADWAEAYMIVDRLGMTVQRDPFTVKPFVEFYTRKRVGGDVANYQAIKIGKVAA